MIMTTPRDRNPQHPQSDRSTDETELFGLETTGTGSDEANLTPAHLPDAIGKRVVRDKVMGKITVYPY